MCEVKTLHISFLLFHYYVMSISHDETVSPETRHKAIKFCLSRSLDGTSHRDKTTPAFKIIPVVFIDCMFFSFTGIYMLLISNILLLFNNIVLFGGLFVKIVFLNCILITGMLPKLSGRNCLNICIIGGIVGF